MTPLSRRALSTLALILALALAGCGGNDRKAQNDYVDTVNQIQAKFSSAYSRIAAQITSTTSKSEDARRSTSWRTRSTPPSPTCAPSRHRMR